MPAARFHHRLQRLRGPVGPAWGTAMGLRARTTDVGSYRVHSVETGEGPEVVALLHGLSGSSRWWQRNIPALSATRRVVVPDLIGFGRSRGAGVLPDIATLADVLAEWLESAVGEPVHLVGHSMGGHLSIHLAARHPERVRRLVLVDAAGIPRPLTARTAARFAYDVAPPRRWGDPRFLPVIWGDVLAAGPFNVLAGLLHVLRDDVRPLLPGIQAPTLIVWGQRDSVIPVADGREMRALIPGSRLLVLPGAYHNAMVDRSKAFNTAVLGFLDGTEVGE